MKKLQVPDQKREILVDTTKSLFIPEKGEVVRFYDDYYKATFEITGVSWPHVKFQEANKDWYNNVLLNVVMIKTGHPRSIWQSTVFLDKVFFEKSGLEQDVKGALKKLLETGNVLHARTKAEFDYVMLHTLKLINKDRRYYTSKKFIKQ